MNKYAQYLRCYTELEEKTKKGKTKPKRVYEKSEPKPKTALQQHIESIGAPYGGYHFVFDTETSISTDQTLTVGCYAVFGMSRDDQIIHAKAGMLTREVLDQLHEIGIFYNPDTVTTEQLTIIQNYATTHDYKLLTKAQFVGIFYRWARIKEALVIGHNLPFDISRIATSWAEARDTFKGGFSFKLCDCTQSKPNYCLYHPNIRIKSVGSKKALIDFTGGIDLSDKNNPKTDKYRGKFVDTATLGRALLGPGDSSLKGLGHRFKADILKSTADEHGVITPEYLDYNVQDVKATFALYRKERDLLKLHDVGKAPWSILSEAGIGKAYLKQMGVPHFMKHHKDFDKLHIGLFMSTYYGGRSEVKLRNQISECIYADFKSQYPSVNAMMGLQELLLCESITVEHNTVPFKKWVDSITVNDLQHMRAWKKLRGIAQIIPDGDILPVRATYNNESPACNIGVNVVYSGIPTWYTFADVIASKLLTGKTPKIVDVMELIPHGQISTTTKKLFGDDKYQIDLNTDDLFTAVIDLRSKVKQDAKQYSKDSDDYHYLDGLQMALKLLANSTSYGVLVEVLPSEFDTPQRGVQYTDKPKKVITPKLEKPGNYFAGPIGTLIPAGGRLLLAIAEKLADDRGIRIGLCDTDSAIFAKPDNQTRDEFRTNVLEITNFFNPLSPYKTEGVLFELEDVNFNESGELEPLYFVGVSTKRYAVFNLKDETPIIRKFTTHGLGHILPPKDYTSSTICLNPNNIKQSERWVHDMWINHINHLQTGNPQPKLIGLNTPVLERGLVTSYPLLSMYRQIPGIKPFSFFTVLPQIPHLLATMFNGGEFIDVTFYAPFASCFEDIKRHIRRRDTNELSPECVSFHLTIEDATRCYFQHIEAKSTPSNGQGWLDRTQMVIVESIYIGKEHSAKTGQDMQIDDNLIKKHYLPLDKLGVFGSTRISGMLKHTNIHRLAGITGIPIKYLHEITREDKEPKPELRRRIIEGITKLVEQPKNTYSVVDDVRLLKPFNIAKESGVGLKTIYRMLNGEEVKPATKIKVLESIDRLKINNSTCN